MSSAPSVQPRIDYVPYLEEQIAIQRDAISTFKRMSVVIAVLGLVILGAALLGKDFLSDTLEKVLGYGGLLTGGMIFFPYRELAPRRAKIATYKLLQGGFASFPNLPADEQQRLIGLADKVIESSLA